MLKSIIRAGLITFGILLVPIFITLFFDSGVDGQGWHWTFSDFIFAFVVIFGANVTFQLVSRYMNGNKMYRWATALAVLACFLLVWVNAAVGIIGEDNVVNLFYFGVILIGFIGLAISRLEPKGLTRTLYLMAFGQLLVPIIALVGWPDLSWGEAGIARTIILNAFFAMMFVASGLLFRNASLTSATPTHP